MGAHSEIVDMTGQPNIVILAAGAGTRMKSDLAKVLHPVAGQAMIAHVLAATAGLKGRVMVVTAPGQRALRETIKPVSTCIQKIPRGTGDAVRIALKALGKADGPVLVAYGDMPCVTGDIFRRMLAALPKTIKGAKKSETLAVLGFHVAGENAYGRLVLDGTGGLERIVEARDATAEERAITFCNSGVMAATSVGLLKRLLAKLTTDNAKGEYYLTDAVALARAEGISCVAAVGDAHDLLGVNSRADLAVAEAVMQSRLRGRALAGGATMIDPSTVTFSHDTKIGRDVVIGPNVWFGPGVRVANQVEIRPFCHIEGARVGKGAIIGPFARLRPGADIGANAHIGNFVEVKQARIARGAKINHLSYVGDAVVGADANIGAGTITCNYDGFDKHLTRVGARSFIGSDVSLVAPVTVGDGAVVGAGSVITRNVPKDALAVTRGTQQVTAQGGARYLARKKAAKRKKAAAQKPRQKPSQKA
jgi:bifunctional UDP-N-acetylglucosamine pyrophosphorylase/glucosamine-1-phosphate N-acetyltransferase